MKFPLKTKETFICSFSFCCVYRFVLLLWLARAYHTISKSTEHQANYNNRWRGRFSFFSIFHISHCVGWLHVRFSVCVCSVSSQFNDRHHAAELIDPKSQRAKHCCSLVVDYMKSRGACVFASNNNKNRGNKAGDINNNNNNNQYWIKNNNRFLCSLIKSFVRSGEFIHITHSSTSFLTQHTHVEAHSLR